MEEGNPTEGEKNREEKFIKKCLFFGGQSQPHGPRNKVRAGGHWGEKTLFWRILGKAVLSKGVRPGILPPSLNLFVAGKWDSFGLQAVTKEWSKTLRNKQTRATARAPGSLSRARLPKKPGAVTARSSHRSQRSWRSHSGVDCRWGSLPVVSCVGSYNSSSLGVSGTPENKKIMCGCAHVHVYIHACSFLDKRSRAFSKFPRVQEKPHSEEVHTVIFQKRTPGSPLWFLEPLSPGCQPTLLLHNPEALKRDHKGKNITQALF